MYHNESSFMVFISGLLHPKLSQDALQEGGAELGLRGPVAAAGLGAAEERRRGVRLNELDGSWTESALKGAKIAGILRI